MLAPEGRPLITTAFVLAAALGLGGYALGGLWGGLLIVLGVLALAFTLYFFRDPKRTTPPGAETLLIAPADGRVILVEDLAHEPLYLKGPARQVSIFLSPLNVHVNRIPADGVIEFDEYVPGQYLVAWHEKASELNERSQLGLRHPSGYRVLFKQIAGAIARRVVYHVRVGDPVRAGQRYGIVRFGSRMDIIVPPAVDLRVKVGDRTVGGETILGRFPAAGDGAIADASVRPVESERVS
ncbi:MAG TPA: phosphatidylserine decarboxylase [Rhodothermales bacterium]|nr:phosphatidylserine decarboxylase [Rhodothermales bacterium]